VSIVKKLKVCQGISSQTVAWCVGERITAARFH
jgi:hypothetical protein